MQRMVLSNEDVATYGVSTKRAHALLARTRAEMQWTEVRDIFGDATAPTQGSTEPPKLVEHGQGTPWWDATALTQGST